MIKQVEAKKIWCLGLDLCFRFGLALVKGKDQVALINNDLNAVAGCI